MKILNAHGITVISNWYVIVYRLGFDRDLCHVPQWCGGNYPGLAVGLTADTPGVLLHSLPVI